MLVNPDVALVERCTVYLSIAPPPLLNGATQTSLTVRFPGVADTERGADGLLTATAS